MKNLVLASLCSLTIAGSTFAAATQLAWQTEAKMVGGQEFWVGRLYLCFDNPNDVLLNVFNASIQINGGQFNHNDLSTFGANSPNGSFDPNDYGNFPPPFGFVGNPMIDTYLTIGGSTSDSTAKANKTTFDPSFAGGPDGVSGGWYNGNPTIEQGQAQEIPGLPGWYTLIGQFAILCSNGPSDATLTVALTQTSNQGLGTPNYEQTSFDGIFKLCDVPAPGALALLGLAGLAGGRRRRA